jgi:N-methylhydantoinase A
LRAVTTERGRDIRRYALVAFGGSGPLHAATLADSVGVRTVIVPPLAGYFSAIGLSYASEQLSVVQAIRMPLRDPGTVERVNNELRGMLSRLNGAAGGHSHMRRTMDLRYRGQAYELSVPLEGDFDGKAVEAIASEFEKLHEGTYGHVPSAPIDVIRVKLTVETPGPEVKLLKNLSGRFDAAESREAHFGDGKITVPVRTRSSLGDGLMGPALIDDPDTTIVVPPNWRATVDAHGNLRLEKQ